MMGDMFSSHLRADSGGDRSVTPGRQLSEAAAAMTAVERALATASFAELPGIFGELARLGVLAWVRIMTPQERTADPSKLQEDDRYLTIHQVSERTGLSRSYLYELARNGVLPIRPMGRREGGKRPRGYRILLSELLSWEADQRKNAVAIQVSNALSSHHDGRRVPPTSEAARTNAGPTRGTARRAPNHAISVGARPGERPGTRRQIDPPAQADSAV
jgi:excisionase family DNA binding protein